MNNIGSVNDEVERIVNSTWEEAAAESEKIRGFCNQIEVYKRIPILPLVVGIAVSFLGSFILNFSPLPFPVIKVFYAFVGLGSALFLLERFLGILCAKVEIRRSIRKKAMEFVLHH